MTDTVTLKPIVAEAIICWGADSMQRYINCLSREDPEAQPTQQGFHQWCCDELQSYASELAEDFEVHEDPEGQPITLEIND